MEDVGLRRCAADGRRLGGEHRVGRGRKGAEAARGDGGLERVCVLPAQRLGDGAVDPLGQARLRGELDLKLAQLRISAWASSSASIRSSSETSWAPASTIVIASGVPQTIRSSVDSFRSGSVGLTASLPSMRPMRTAPTGPRNGIGESMSAADEPLMARMSCGCTWSAENVVTMTWTSFL